MTAPVRQLVPLTWLVDAARAELVDAARAELIDAETTTNPLARTRHIIRARKLLDEIQRHAGKDSDDDADRSTSHEQV